MNTWTPLKKKVTKEREYDLNYFVNERENEMDEFEKLRDQGYPPEEIFKRMKINNMTDIHRFYDTYAIDELF